MSDHDVSTCPWCAGAARADGICQRVIGLEVNAILDELGMHADQARPRKGRPNANPVLELMREDDLAGDPWGTAMSWAFAVAEVLYDADPNSVPASLEYRPAICGPEAGPDSEDWPTAQVWHLLHQTPGYWADPSFGARMDELETAARVLSRYLDWCRRAGMSY